MKCWRRENSARPLRREIVKALCKNWDYRQVHQEGSHIILQTATPSHQRIPVPDHNPVRIGTLNSILRLVVTHKGVDKQAVLASF